MQRANVHRFSAIALVLVTLISNQGFAQSPSASIAARFVPADVSMVVSLNALGDRWNAISHMPLVTRLLELPQFKAAMEEKQFQDLLKGQEFVESIFGRPIGDLLQDFTQNGAVLAWKNEKDMVLLFQPTTDVFDRLKQTLKEFASAAALGNAKQSEPQLFSTNYRGFDAFGLNKARIGFADGWVVVSSASNIGKSVIDRMAGDKGKSIADEPWYRQATALANSLNPAEAPAFTALLNMEKLRPILKMNNERGKDAGQELFFGGILDAIGSAPIAAVSGDITTDFASARIAAPRSKANSEKLEYFYGEGTTIAAPRSLELPNRVFSARWHRDIGLFWKMAPQIINDENALAGIAKAESDISTLMGGMVTVSDVLGYLGADVELLSVQPMVHESPKKPSIQIPATAITGTLRNPEKAQPALRLAFQQVVSFANTNAGPGKYPPLEVITEREAGTTTITGSYLQMGKDDMYDNPAADLYKNFSPTLGFRGDRFVLASHRELATQILNTPATGPAPPNPQGHLDNTVLELWPAELSKVGKLNREPLISQRMLSTGQGRPSALSDVDTILEILEYFENARLRMLASDDSLVLEFDTRLVGASAKQK